MDAELISSLLFRQIETAVRVFIQLGNGSRGADGSDADAAGNLALGTGNLADLTHKTVQEKFQILLAEGRIDQNREFIAAQPADGSVFREVLLQPLGNLVQNFVSFRVPHGVVDVLKVVHIQNHEVSGRIFLIVQI